jgi:hypothetical protein
MVREIDTKDREPVGLRDLVRARDAVTVADVRVPPTDADPVRVPPTDADPVRVPPTDADPVRVPPTDADPERVPPTDADPERVEEGAIEDELELERAGDLVREAV